MFSNTQLQALVPQRSSTCSLGKENFGPGHTFVSLLTMLEEGCTRQDFCPACWEKIKQEKIKEGGIHWFGKIAPKKEKPKSYDQVALEHFKAKVAKQEDKKALYLLALYLERRKQLVSRGTTKGRHAFELIETEEVFLLEKVPLHLAEIQTTLHTLMDELNAKR